MEKVQLSQSTEAQTMVIALRVSTRSLTSAITSRDKIELAQAVAIYQDKGRPNFPALFSVPISHRLPALMERDLGKTLALVSGAITMYLESSGISPELSVDMAEAVLDSCGEDQLSVQDLVLFLKGAAAGKYGKFLRNVPTPMDFMDMLEQYRQQRYEEIQRIRDEQHTQLKAQGPTVRESDDQEAVKQLQRSAVIQYYIENGK